MDVLLVISYPVGRFARCAATPVGRFDRCAAIHSIRPMLFSLSSIKAVQNCLLPKMRHILSFTGVTGVQDSKEWNQNRDIQFDSRQDQISLGISDPLVARDIAAMAMSDSDSGMEEGGIAGWLARASASLQESTPTNPLTTSRESQSQNISEADRIRESSDSDSDSSGIPSSPQTSDDFGLHFVIKFVTFQGSNRYLGIQVPSD